MQRDKQNPHFSASNQLVKKLRRNLFGADCSSQRRFLLGCLTGDVEMKKHKKILPLFLLTLLLTVQL